jgi:uncharacterized protein (TIGR03437 family)
MNTMRSLAGWGVSHANGRYSLALLSILCWTATASPGQEVDYPSLLKPRPAAIPARANATVAQAQDSPLIYIYGNAASLLGPFSAGQLITIFGPGLGPTPGVGSTVSKGFVTTSAGGTQVTFDGVPGPILYAGANQINTIIPCGVAGHASTSAVVTFSGASSTPVSIPLSDAAPGIFTLKSGGAGQGAILNEDYSVNGPSNPAAHGSTVIVYATGLGKTSPGCIDGEIYNDTLPAPVLAVTAKVGGVSAQVAYGAQAPGIVSGVAQVNLVIPADAPTGSAVPLTILSGTFSSQPGVTLAIK